MKKLLLFATTLSLIFFVACSSAEDNGGQADQNEQEMNDNANESVDANASDDGAADADAASADDAGEQLADHVCSDKCTKEACHLKCGEKGHVCSEACHASHDHGDDEGHDHDGEGDHEH